MKDVLIAAILQARIAEAHIKLEAMRAENLYCLSTGETPAHSAEEFRKIIDDTGIHHNAVWGLIRDHRE